MPVDIAPMMSRLLKTAWQSEFLLPPQHCSWSLTYTSYDGYNKDLIDRFCSMGFDVERVVAAFRFVGADRMGGTDYRLDEGRMGDITARLLGE